MTIEFWDLLPFVTVMPNYESTVTVKELSGFWDLLDFVTTSPKVVTESDKAYIADITYGGRAAWEPPHTQHPSTSGLVNLLFSAHSHSRCYYE